MSEYRPDARAELNRVSRALATAIATGDGDDVRQVVAAGLDPVVDAATAFIASPDQEHGDALLAAARRPMDLWNAACVQLWAATEDVVLVAAVQGLLGDQTPTIRLESGELRQRVFAGLEQSDQSASKGVAGSER